MTLPLRKTKIVATVGPASSSTVMLEKMIRAGMNVARLNFSHGDFADHRQAIENIRAASQTAGPASGHHGGSVGTEDTHRDACPRSS